MPSWLSRRHGFPSRMGYQAYKVLEHGATFDRASSHNCSTNRIFEALPTPHMLWFLAEHASEQSALFRDSASTQFINVVVFTVRGSATGHTRSFFVIHLVTLISIVVNIHSYSQGVGSPQGVPVVVHERALLPSFGHRILSTFELTDGDCRLQEHEQAIQGCLSLCYTHYPPLPS